MSLQERGDGEAGAEGARIANINIKQGRGSIAIHGRVEIVKLRGDKGEQRSYLNLISVSSEERRLSSHSLFCVPDILRRNFAKGSLNKSTSRVIDFDFRDIR